MIAVIDTCVIIDALHKRAPFEKAAQEIFLAAADDKIIGIVTAKSVTDVFYVLRRILHSDAETRKHIRAIFDIFRIEDTCALDCLQALNAPIKDYEDAVMIETAKRIGADCIITRNLKDYSQSDISVYSPQEFLDILKETE